MAGAEGFLLLTIPNCTLTTQYGASQSGVLALECVTIPLQAPQTVFSGSGPRDTSNERDVWLVIRLGTFETIVSPIQAIVYARNQHQFTIPAEDGEVVTLTIPAPMSDAAVEDLESLEVLLGQYGILQDSGTGTSPGKGGDKKGHLVLVDEDNGATLGTLGEQFQIREAPGLVSKGHEKDPVVVEIPEQGEQIFVHNIAPDEQDWLLRSAGYISRGILYATDLATKGMHTAAQRYVAGSTPTTQPIVFSETANSNMRRVHQLSGQAVKVTAHTTGMIHKLIDAGIDRVSKPKPGDRSGTATPNTPPRPPRLLNRLLITTDLLLTTLEHSASQLVTHGTEAASVAAGHRYGPDVGASTKAVGETVRNVGVVYIDARGVGRRALIKRAGKRVIKGRLGSGREIVLGDESTTGGVGQLHVAGPNEKPAGPSRTTSNISTGGNSKKWF